MAKEKFVRLPGGKELVFPATMSDTEIRMQVLDQILGPVPSFELGPEPKREAGFTGGFGEGVSTLGGLPEAAQYLARPTGERRKAAAEAGESEYEFQRLKDIEGLGGLGRFVKEQAGSALGFIAAPAAAAAAAARATPAPIKPFAATGAFLTAAGAQYLTNTTTRQAAEQEVRVKEGKAPELPDATKIALTSAAQAGLDVAGFRLFRPLGEILGLAGRENAEKALKEVAETAAKDPVKAAEKVLGKKSIAAGVVTGAAFEAAQEVAQQALERYGAGLDLASDDALSEYFESAVGGGLLGGPIGGVSTYAGNVRKGIYNKDFLQQTADAVQGKTINLNKEWDNYSKQIHIDAPTFDLTDDQGNFLTYTPDLLERLGINPEAKAINVGGKDRVTIPMSEVLKADTGNETVGKALMYMFRNDRLKLGEEIKNSAKLMEPDVLAEKVKEYETLTAALKTYEAFFNPRQAVNSPTNFVVQQSPTDPKKFIVFNPVTGTNVANQNFASAENAQKYIDRKLEQEKKGNTGPEVLMPEDLEIQADPIKPEVFTVFNKKTGKYDTKKEFKTEVEAQEYIDKKLGVPPAKETVAARQAQDVRAQLYKDLAARYPDNPDAVKEITTMAKDLETTMSPTDALAQAETTYLQDQEAATETTTKTAPSAEGSTYFAPEAFKDIDQGRKSRSKIVEMSPDDFLRMVPPNSFVKTKLENVNKLIEEGKKFSSLPYLITQEDPKTGKAKVIGVEGQHRATALKQMGVTSIPVHIRSQIRWSEQDNSENSDYWKGQWPTELEAETGTNTIPYPVSDIRAAPPTTTAAPPPPKAPRARKAPTGQPYEKYTAQMREMLAGVDPESGLAEDLNEFINLAEESKDTTIAKELSQLAQTYAQATRDSTNPNLSQMEQDRALERASNIFETLKEVGQKSTPQNAAEMKAAKDATGNAETANKVAAKVTKDVCG
jgi:hypothetical protein